VVAKAENWSKADSFRARADFEKMSPLGINLAFPEEPRPGHVVAGTPGTPYDLALDPPAVTDGRTLPYFLSANFLRDPSSGLDDILTPSLFLQLCCFLHQLAGAVCKRFSPFAFLVGLLT
jgi:hypothetical protein